MARLSCGRVAMEMYIDLMSRKLRPHVIVFRLLRVKENIYSFAIVKGV